MAFEMRVRVRPHIMRCRFTEGSSTDTASVLFSSRTSSLTNSGYGTVVVPLGPVTATPVGDGARAMVGGSCMGFLPILETSAPDTLEDVLKHRRAVPRADFGNMPGEVKVV